MKRKFIPLYKIISPHLFSLPLVLKGYSCLKGINDSVDNTSSGWSNGIQNFLKII